MLKKLVVIFTVFVFYKHYVSSARINIAEREKDIDLISEIIKLREDPCSSNPCLNSGECREDGETYKCECSPPYKGKQCETGITDEPDILMSYSSDSIITSRVTDENATDKIDSYNWTFSNSSSVRIDEKVTSIDSSATNDVMPTTLKKGICEIDSDCLNGGTCNNKGENSSCDCASNFEGFRCEINLLCVRLEQSCRIINSVCVVVDNHAICDCPNGTLYHRKSGLCEDICDPRKCLHGTCEILGRTYKCNCDHGYTGSHCDEKERVHHENFVPWFTVIASIGLFMCVLQIAMFCVVCQIKTFISSS